MNRILKRAATGAATVAVGASLVPLLGATAAYAADGYQAQAVPTPAAGTSSTPFELVLPSGAACDGDSANDQWRIHSFIIEAGREISPDTLKFDPIGPTPADYDGSDGTINSPMFEPTGAQYSSKQTVTNTGVIPPNTTFNFDIYDGSEAGAAMPDGEYQVGIACTDRDVNLRQWWVTTITVSDNDGSSFNYVTGAVDEAPVLDAVSPGDGMVTAEFSHTPSDAANTTYTATATPVGGGAAVTKTGPSSPIVIDGLTNGTEYSVTVRATNNAGESPESNAMVAQPAVGAQPPATNLTVDPGAPGSTSVLLDWDAPAGGLTPTGYTVTIDPAEGAVTVDEANTSAEITGLTSGNSYECTVTPTYADPTAVATPATVNCTPTADGVSILEQNVTVTRPAGALVFTQRCEDSSTGEPLADAEFSDAPCAIEFGTATRIMEGENRGRFFEASASLNDVQVDSWGDDTGWNVTGDISDAFVAGPGANQQFSGDQLGWAPKLANSTDGLTVDLGDEVAPGTTDGMTASPRLASSPAGSSLGIAELDADLRLLLPVQARAGVYSATLTMTATPAP